MGWMFTVNFVFSINDSSKSVAIQVWWFSSKSSFGSFEDKGVLLATVVIPQQRKVAKRLLGGV